VTLAFAECPIPLLIRSVVRTGDGHAYLHQSPLPVAVVDPSGVHDPSSSGAHVGRVATVHARGVATLYTKLHAPVPLLVREPRI
jgi:hypothetical protein